MGLNKFIYSAIDYMLGTILIYLLFVLHLLFIYTFYLYKLDASKWRRLLLNSQNNESTILSSRLVIGSKINIQSAENCKEFSETVRQLPDKEDYKF